VRCVVRSTVRWSIQWRRVLAVGSFQTTYLGLV
jgi:hypothetical protein